MRPRAIILFLTATVAMVESQALRYREHLVGANNDIPAIMMEVEDGEFQVDDREQSSWDILLDDEIGRYVKSNTAAGGVGETETVGNVPDRAILRYRIRVATAGDWYLACFTLTQPDAEEDEANDFWFRFSEANGVSSIDGGDPSDGCDGTLVNIPVRTG